MTEDRKKENIELWMNRLQQAKEKSNHLNARIQLWSKTLFDAYTALNGSSEFDFSQLPLGNEITTVIVERKKAYDDMAEARNVLRSLGYDIN
jgi:hypothetical protein